MVRMFAIDPALNNTGVAIFDIYRKKLISTHIIKGLDEKTDLMKRYEHLQSLIRAFLHKENFKQNDLIICEEAAAFKNAATVFKLEYARVVWEILGRTLGGKTPFRICPRSVHVELLGLRGRQQERKEVKLAARKVFEMLYPDKKDLSQDEIDAVLIGELALTKLRQLS